MEFIKQPITIIIDYSPIIIPMYVFIIIIIICLGVFIWGVYRGSMR